MSADQTRTVNSDVSCEEMVHQVRRLYREHRYVTFSWHTGKQRTLTQSAALHLWLGWLAETLNDAGYDMRRTLKHDVEIPWSKSACKDFLWRPIQEAMIGKASTTEAERPDYARVQEVLARHLSEKFGIQCPEWPKKPDTGKPATTRASA